MALRVLTASLLKTALALSADPFPSGGSGWEWVPMPGSKCMAGAETGVYIKHNPSKAAKLAIYLEGGGACFNTFTCDTAASSPKPGTPGSGGEFSETDKRNPYIDFTWIWVPYCTGDVHLGDIVQKFSGSNRNFVGHLNLGLIMDRAVATWPTLDHLVLTGESAGGFGAASNFYFVRSFYPGDKAKKAAMVDDSGPILDDIALAPCLVEKWRQAWNINASLPKGCPCIGNKGGLVSSWKWTMDALPNDGVGLISSISDATISTFFSFGDAGCRLPLPGKYTNLPGGLDRLAASGVPVYMIPGNVHTHTGSQSAFYTKQVNGTYLYDWVGKVINGLRTETPTIRPTPAEEALGETEEPRYFLQLPQH